MELILIFLITALLVGTLLRAVLINLDNGEDFEAPEHWDDCVGLALCIIFYMSLKDHFLDFELIKDLLIGWLAFTKSYSYVWKWFEKKLLKRLFNL